MNIAVCLKQVPDTETIIKIKDSVSIDESDVKWIINPYDEYAVEESIKIKERTGDSRFTVYSIGPERVETALRTCIALGADGVVHLNDPLFAGTENLLAATVLAAALGKEYDLVLFGRQAIDDDGSLVAGMVAHMLGLPFVSEINSLEFTDGKKARASRLVEGSTEIWEMPLPAVLSCQKGLNEPRLPALKGIMKAKKQTIEKMTAADLGLDADKLKNIAGARTRTKLEFPPPRPPGKTLDSSDESIAEVVRWLKEEAGVI